MLSQDFPDDAGRGAAPVTIAVMQPYFFPYAGYYRLFARADCFIILDCVQFPRRGRVHRCEVSGPDGNPQWLTLPLARQPRETLIRDLAFAPGAPVEMAARLARHRWIAEAEGPLAGPVRAALSGPMDGVVDYLECQLRLVASLLGLKARIMRSSQFGLGQDVRGQDRIIALARAAGGEVYVNLPGGRRLYDLADFRRAGLELSFLPDYEGPHKFMLKDLLYETPETLRRDILSSC